MLPEMANWKLTTAKNINRHTATSQYVSSSQQYGSDESSNRTAGTRHCCSRCRNGSGNLCLSGGL